MGGSMKSIPVNIISGFLGSGKTTAILALLKQKTSSENWAVVINEFGKISIDGQTLQSSSGTGTVFEISGGCICCSARAYFQEDLEKIVQSGKFDRIIIEPSGLGGIDMVSEIIAGRLELELLPAICLVDITAIDNPRLKINFIYKSQISRAALIVFSKCDLLVNSDIQNQQIEKFKLLFPEKMHFLCGQFFLPEMLSMECLKTQSGNKVHFALGGSSVQTAKDFQEINLRFGAEYHFEIEKMPAFFIENPSVIRAKGHLRNLDGWNLFNYTLSGCNVEPCEPKVQNEIIFIAEKSDSDHKNIKEGFMKLLAP